MPSMTIRIADEMRTSGYLTAALVEAQRQAKQRLCSLLHEPKTQRVVQLPTRELPSRHASIWVSDEDLARLHMISAVDASPGEIANALLIRDFSAWKEQQAQAGRDTVKPQEPPNALELMGIASRPEQAQVLQSLEQLVKPVPPQLDGAQHKSKVLFLEAGTGIGKTLAYLAHAVTYAAAGPARRRAWIAAPSFALLRQVEAEITGKLLQGTLSDAQREVLNGRCMLAGQAEWVSLSALESLLQGEASSDAPKQRNDEEQEAAALDQRIIHAEQRDAVLAWCEQELERAREWVPSAEDAPPWSMDSLLQAVPQFEFSDDVGVHKRLTDADPGYVTYRAQFERARNSDLVLLTHTMLATLLKQRYTGTVAHAREHLGYSERLQEWRKQRDADPENAQRFQDFYLQLLEAMASDPAAELAQSFRLPDVDLLVIDEAHAFEDAMAKVFSVEESVYQALRRAKHLAENHQDAIGNDSIAPLAAVLEDLQALGRRVNASATSSHKLDGPTLERIIGALEVAITPRKRAPKDAVQKMRTSQAFKRLEWLAGALRSFHTLLTAPGQGRIGGFLTWSPRLSRPRLLLGMHHLNNELAFLWTVVARRTALVSGTLYEHNPSASCLTMQKALAVHSSQVVAMQPIHPTWAIKPVEALVVRDARHLNGLETFRRPSTRDDPVVYKRRRPLWIDDVSEYIAQAYSDAKGGVLVLGSAYGDIEEISARVRGLLSLKGQDLGEQGLMLVQRPAVKLGGLRESFLDAAKRGRPLMFAVGAAWTGFDLHDPDNPDALTDLVILNAPFNAGGATVPRLRRDMNGSGHFDRAFQAGLMVRQAAGRLVRSPDTPPNRRLHWLDGRIHDRARMGLFSAVVRFLRRYTQEQGGAGWRWIQ